jgi:hypothetical protein
MGQNALTNVRAMIGEGPLLPSGPGTFPHLLNSQLCHLLRRDNAVPVSNPDLTVMAQAEVKEKFRLVPHDEPDPLRRVVEIPTYDVWPVADIVPRHVDLATCRPLRRCAPRQLFANKVRQSARIDLEFFDKTLEYAHTTLFALACSGRISPG